MAVYPLFTHWFSTKYSLDLSSGEKKPYKQNQILKNILASGGSVILHHYPVKPLKVTL